MYFIRETLKPIQTLDSEIAELLDADSIEKEHLEALDFEADIQESICWIDAALLSFGKSDLGDVVTHVNNSHNSSVVGNEGSSNPQSTSNQSSSQKKVKLSKLSLPNFHGSVTEWLSFWESFDSAINQNSDLFEIEKFQYLRSLLQGSAINVISGLTLSSANYHQAIKLLQKRYSNKQVNYHSLYGCLIKLAPVKSSVELDKLRCLCDKKEGVVRSLQSLEISADMYGTFFNNTNLVI